MDSIGVVEDGYRNAEGGALDSGFGHIKEMRGVRIAFRLVGERLSNKFLLLLASWGDGIKEGCVFWLNSSTYNDKAQMSGSCGVSLKCSVMPICASILLWHC